MALITFILLAVKQPGVQVQLLVWIFVMRIAMLVSSAAAYFINGAIAKAKYEHANEMNFEHPLTSLVWITSVVSIGLTYFISSIIVPDLGGDTTSMVEAGVDHFVRHAGGSGDPGIGESVYFRGITACE